MPANKELRSLYNGEVQIEFFPDSHRYKMVGERKYLTSVTAITGIFDKSRALISWVCRLANEHFQAWLNTQDGAELVKAQVEEVFAEAINRHNVVKEEAASVGGQVHDYAEAFAKAMIGKGDLPGIPTEAPLQVINGINAFLEWVNAHTITFHESELLLYSKDFDYVGQTDVVATVDGKKLLLDYKTSSGVYPDHRWQAAAYRMAYEEERKEQLDGIVILHFNKDTGEFKPYPISEFDYPKDCAAFLGCLNVKKRAKELEDAWRAEQKQLTTA
jgi:hypothetical protein